MAGIQDIGNGDGYLYMTKPDGSTIVKTDKNTVDGERNMRISGGIASPYAARKSATGTIVVTNSSGAGQISTITINGVAQISAPIAIASATESVVAASIATAINSYTPGSGYDYTASSSGDTVTIFAPLVAGSAPNGFALVLTKTGASTFTTTDMSGGSSSAGVYDTTFGYRFFINSDVAADPTDLTGSVEITNYLVMRGQQTGVLTNDITLSNDGISGINRGSFMTLINADTQGGAASDVLAYIDPLGFVEGDIIMIRAADVSHVITVESAPVSTSPVPTKNLYLTSDVPFVTDEFQTLTLQYKYLDGIGPAFVETTRSVSTGTNLIQVDRLTALALMAAGTLQRTRTYLITDVGDTGVYLNADRVDKFSLCGTAYWYTPDWTGANDHSGIVGYNSTLGVWLSTMTPSVGDVVVWNLLNYVNTSGANGGAPDFTPSDWTPLSKQTDLGYRLDQYSVEYDIVNDVFVKKSDAFGNIVTGVDIGVNQLPWGHPSFTNNVISDCSIGDQHNMTGSFYNNTLIESSLFGSQTSFIYASYFNNTSISGNENCYIHNVTAIQSNFSANQYCVIEYSYFSLSTIGIQVSPQVISVYHATVSNANFNVGFLTATSDSYYVTVNGDDYPLVSNVTLTRARLSNWVYTAAYTGPAALGSPTQLPLSNFSVENAIIDFSFNQDSTAFYSDTVGIPLFGNKDWWVNRYYYINTESNNYPVFVDLSTALSGTVLTLPYNAEYCGQIYLYNCAGQTIDQIVTTLGMNSQFNHEMVFHPLDGSVDFHRTLYGSLASNKFASADGNETLQYPADAYAVRRGAGSGHEYLYRTYSIKLN